MNFWWIYSFLNACTYEDFINNSLYDCSSQLLTWLDVDNDNWKEWVYQDSSWNVQIFNNAIKENSDWTYSISFYEMFRSNWLDYCTVDTWSVPYYYKQSDWSCSTKDTGEWCKTKNYLIYQDADWNNYYYKLDWNSKYDKIYTFDKTDDADIICDDD